MHIAHTSRGLFLLVALMWYMTTVTAQSSNQGISEVSRKLPDEVELKAAYCIAVTQDQITNFSSNRVDAEKQLDRTQDERIKSFLKESISVSKRVESELLDKINRLQSFLLPRLPMLDTASVSAAYNRGQADVRKQSEGGSSNRCTSRCQSLKSSQVSGCLTECMQEDEIYVRTIPCQKLAFLPF